MNREKQSPRYANPLVYAVLVSILLHVLIVTCYKMTWMGKPTVSPTVFEINLTSQAYIMTVPLTSQPKQKSNDPKTAILVKSVPSKSFTDSKTSSIINSTKTLQQPESAEMVIRSDMLPENHAQIRYAVSKALAARFYYPYAARRNGWEGKVLLGFAVESNGKITDAHVAQGSGYSILDESALSALQQVQQLPTSAGMVNSTRLQLNLPVIYRLHGG